jgi:26S proteasome regulatory subunit N1
MAVPQDAKPESDSTAAKQKAPPGKPDPDADLSEEDLELKKNIELMVERLGDADAGVARSALDALTKEIHTTTSSMTAVPKPLKFLRPHLDTLVKLFDAMSPSELRRGIADVLSLLCSTVAGKEGERQGLTYKLQGNTSDLATWGHEYMRHLAGEIAEEYKARTERSADVAELIGLVDQIVPYHMTHNAGEVCLRSRRHHHNHHHLPRLALFSGNKLRNSQPWQACSDARGQR